MIKQWRKVWSLQYPLLLRVLEYPAQANDDVAIDLAFPFLPVAVFASRLVAWPVLCVVAPYVFPQFVVFHSGLGVGGVVLL